MEHTATLVSLGLQHKGPGSFTSLLIKKGLFYLIKSVGKQNNDSPSGHVGLNYFII
jgi:hypothetical protein